ncbi:response regulator transcription factor [Dactylosporangium fulvum]|uniref:Response regulator transcription factor n=1 Tax=Dactylosporangium fulvum TaxID=53359 RepID=A0ABY5W679_9ACTN|nr:response regulator transcription factor [Dactylosporangium fulvum]UWP85503.1 response regulator transcription factor [Dactylosporangium fulvum]
MRDISVLVVDDHTLFAEALQARLSCESGLRPVHVAFTADAARTYLAAHHPQVAVVDVTLGNDSGVDLARYVAETAPTTRVVMLTAVESVDAVVAVLRHGARAWLPKTVDGDHLVRVIRGVAEGEAWLSPSLLGQALPGLVARSTATQPDLLGRLTKREREVLQCMVDGLSRAEIAIRLHLSTNTVRTHTQNLLAKFEVHSTLESVAVALRHGLRASGH